MSATIISCDIDLNAAGKQNGYLHLPHSVHRSAYGRILTPIVQIKNGAGPTVLLMAGNHGDEYEGQIALSKLCRELNVSDIQGRLILMPMTNQPAVAAGTRTSPIDAGNLNRTFPGNPLGSPTEVLADYIEQHLMPECDYFFDFHSGGSSLFYPATLLRGLGHSPEESQKLVDLQAAFDAPYAWVFTSGGGRGSTARTAMGAAGRKGAVTVMAELGGGGSVSRDILALTDRGIKRMLHSVGILPGFKPDAARNQTRELTIVDSVIAYDPGMFEPFVDIGSHVQAGDMAGAIHFPNEPWREPVCPTFRAAGMVLCKRTNGLVEPGDCLFQVGADLADALQGVIR